MTGWCDTGNHAAVTELLILFVTVTFCGPGRITVKKLTRKKNGFESRDVGLKCRRY